VVIARDLVIGVGALLFRLWFGPLRGRPSTISKFNTGMQLAYLLAVILASAMHFPPREVIEALAAVTVITTLASGVDYVARFVERALAQIAAA
jgi:cardiolipin synthase